MRYPWIAVDFDHILLNARHHLSRSHLRAIEAFLHSQGQVILLSGRSEQSVHHLWAGNPPLAGYHVFHQGALVSTWDKSQTILECPLQPDLCSYLIQMANDFRLNPLIYYREQIFVSKPDKPVRKLLDANGEHAILVDQYSGLNPSGILKFLFHGSPYDLQSITRQIQARFQDVKFVQDEKQETLTILQGQASIPHALAEIAKTGNMSLSNCLLIGDRLLDSQRAPGSQAADGTFIASSNDGLKVGKILARFPRVGLNRLVLTTLI